MRPLILNSPVISSSQCDGTSRRSLRATEWLTASSQHDVLNSGVRTSCTELSCKFQAPTMYHTRDVLEQKHPQEVD